MRYSLSLFLVACALSAQAADTKIEFRRAETKKAEGLVEAKVVGSDEVIYLHKEAALTNADVAAARVVKAGDQPALELEFTAEGAKKLEKATAQHIDKPLAILIEGKVVSAPILRSKLSDKAVVTGNFTKEELERLVRGLKPR